MIRPNFTKADIRNKIDFIRKSIQSRIIQELSALGEECVNRARSIPLGIGFTDQSGNLRSSIGYGIYVDAKEVLTYFPGDKEEGKAGGMSLAKEIGAKTKGFALVVVAGMSYATYVEATGRDVLTSAELIGKGEFNKRLQNIITDVITDWKG